MHRDVVRFVARAATLVALNALVLAALVYASSAYVLRHHWRNWETESDLAIMPAREHVDLVFLGTSHARTFSRASNHRRVEMALDRRILNLARGGGGGVVPMRAALSVFFERGNTVDTIVYFIDPWVLYSAAWNEDNAFYEGEPFSLDFARQVYRYAGARGLRDYVLEKLTWSWIDAAPDRTEQDERIVPARSADAAAKRIANLYNAGTDPAVFRKYAALLEDLVVFATARTRLVFVIPPTLLGDEPGTPELRALLKRFRSTYGVPFFDLRDSITTPALFGDHDHLNTRGVTLFAAEFLRPALDGDGRGPQTPPLRTAGAGRRPS